MRRFALKSASLAFGLSAALSVSANLFAAELDGFDIQTEGKSVTVTLFTDHPVPYTTQQIDRQFAVLLDNTRLSSNQLKQGLPVVIDNKNLFIGRAVSAGNNQVKVILPNLSAKDFKIVVQQKPQLTAMRAEVPEPLSSRYPINALALSDTATKKPSSHSRDKLPTELVLQRQPLQPSSEYSHPQKPSGLHAAKKVEKIALRLPTEKKPLLQSPTQTQSLYSLQQPNSLSFGTTTVANTVGDTIERQSRTIWNPYVISRSSGAENTPDHKKEETARQSTVYEGLPYVSPKHPPAEIVAKMPSVYQETTAPWYLKKKLPKAFSLPAIEALGQPLFTDNGLHGNNSVPFIQNSPLPATTASTIAPQQQNVTIPTVSSQQSQRQPQPWFNRLPVWLMAMLGLFLGGVGIFTFIGGMVLLKMLFQQGKSFLESGQQPINPMSKKVPNVLHPVDKPKIVLRNKKQGLYATVPQLTFEDKAHYQSIDYLRSDTKTIADAVRNLKKRARKKALTPTLR